MKVAGGCGVVPFLRTNDLLMWENCVKCLHRGASLAIIQKWVQLILRGFASSLPSLLIQALHDYYLRRLGLQGVNYE